jgi:hypothetical protein
MGPGDLVVCVNVGIINGADNTDLHLLRKGDIYTVEDFITDADWQGACGVKVFEVQTPANAWWVAERFRPCRKTSIDCLTACLKEREREEA